MGFLKPDIESRETGSQATPLAEDILKLLRGQIAGGDFGSGVTKTQRSATDSAEKFIDDRQSPEAFAELMGPLRKMFDIQTNRSAAATREAFSQTGNRFSTSLGKVESQGRNERDLQLDSLLSELFLQEQGRLLQGIELLGKMGSSNIAPFMALGQQGINPDQTIVSDSPVMSLLKLGVPIAKAAVTGGAGGVPTG